MVANVIIHNLRSVHNVGSILRSCDGFGVSHIYIGGTSPYPRVRDDGRLPHLIAKQTEAIAKTALGAESTLSISHYDNIFEVLEYLTTNTVIVGLEQDMRSVPINAFSCDKPITLILGEEVDGIDKELRSFCSTIVEIPMRGSKESFNVSVACGIALFALNASHQ